MHLDQLEAVELAVKQARNQVVHAAHGNERHPAERAGMHVADGPVGVVRQRIHRLDGHHRSLERGHAVEGYRDDQQAQHRVGAQFLPCPGQCHDAVDHATPGGSQQDQRHYHAE
jgi:hypothetical protein